MTRRPALLYLLPALTAGALALAAPAAVQADETNSATTPATSSATSSPPAATETQTGSTAGEAPAPTSSTAGSPEARCGGSAAAGPGRARPGHERERLARRPRQAQVLERGAGRRPRAQPRKAPAGVRAKKRAPAPSTLTPSLPLNLRSSIFGVPAFFIESFQIPPFLLPIFQAAGTAYGIPWQVLAAINEVETDYGRDLSVSSAGAEGWMQFLPSEWAQYGVDANGDGFKDPYNPADAIFAAARYLRAAGGDTNIKAAVFSYNHSQAYVESVMLRAQLLGGTPSELLGAITGLTEARFPVHAASHYSDGFPTVSAAARSRRRSSARRSTRRRERP